MVSGSCNRLSSCCSERRGSVCHGAITLSPAVAELEPLDGTTHNLLKFPLIKTFLLLAALASLCTPLHAADAPLSYAPAVVTLTGTVFQEAYGEDPPSPRYRGQQAWILHLEHPISLRGVPSDKFNVDAANVKEVVLNVDHAKHPLPKSAFKKTHFVVTGTLYQSGTTNFLRPVVLSVTNSRPASPK